MTDITDRLQELAEGAARQMRPPGADLARRRGRRRRRAWQTQGPDGKRAVVAYLTLSVPGQPDTGAQNGFEEPVRLGVDDDLAEGNPDLPVRPVYGVVSRRTAKVVVIPEQGMGMLSPVPAELLDGGPGLPAKFWVVVLPPGQSVHQTRSYDAYGRELCHQDPERLEQAAWPEPGSTGRDSRRPWAIPRSMSPIHEKANLTERRTS
jgi:hypothetical protein